MSPTTIAVRQPARRGRPHVRGVKRWQGEAVARVVRDALAARDVHDWESVTEATSALRAAVAALLGRPLSDSSRHLVPLDRAFPAHALLHES